MWARWTALARWLVALGMLGGGGAWGQPNAVDVPAALEEWRGWALHGKGYRGCPFVYNAGAAEPAEFMCAWPGRLDLVLDADGGTFSQPWTVYEDVPVPLPGDAEHWPRDVAVDGRAATLVLRAGRPTVWLAPGSYRLSGQFTWRERPASLPLPASVGLVALTLDGEPVPLPRRGVGLWLGATAGEEAEADALAVEVYRRFEDDVPTRLETQLELSVAGSVREERLRGVLPAGFLPMRMMSNLPARLDQDGQLRVQVRPGEWYIEVHARAEAVLDRIVMATPGGVMPSVEFWAFDAKPALRSVLAEGARPVDPIRAGAYYWPRLPTFQLAPGDALTVVERSRGQLVAANDLAAKRDLWLDFNRERFAFADAISGEMRVGWRLDLQPPYELLAATEDGSDLLVTRSAAGDATGIELRTAEVDVQALGRIDRGGAMPIAGWLSNMELAATLHLPPGNKLLAALGVENAPTSWISQWRLLDFFVLLVVTIATVRLFGRVAGLTALLALTLSFHEPGAPVWTWLNLLAAVALTRVAPPGRLLRLARSYRLASFAVLLLLLIPFGIAQVRLAVYPQLEPAGHREGRTIGLFEMLAGDLPAPAPPDVPDIAAGVLGPDAPSEDVEELVVTGSYIRREPFDAPGRDMLGEDNTPTQAGAGKPSWEWAAHPLGWAGAVSPEDTMRLIIVPPWLTGILRLVATAALGLFAARLAFDLLGRTWHLPRWPARGGATAASAAIVVAAIVTVQSAAAQTPAPALLEALEERLLQPPPCTPACAEVVHADVSAGATELAITLQVHALASVAVPLPGDVAGWLPATVTTGDAPVPVQRRDDALWAAVPPGRHTLALRGPLPPGAAVEIPFPAAPRTVTAASEHWFVAGIEDGALPGGTLSLTRLRPDQEADREEAATAQWEASHLPAFVEIERTLLFGPREWRVATAVRRVAPEGGVINFAVPLLAGESIVSAEHDVTQGRVMVAMDPSVAIFGWRSTLPRVAAMSLLATADQPWREIWRFEISPAWRVEFSGLPPSHPEGENAALITFHPRPGETLTLAIARPETVPGGTLAFDRVALETTASDSWRQAALVLDYRSTRGGSQTIRLPAAAELDAVAIDGTSESLPLLDGELNLPILPGTHEVRIGWRENVAVAPRVATPVVDLGAPAANVTTALTLPKRWLLFATGPSLGPAVLYWSELLALIVAALVLGRIQTTPLKTWHWLLLGLGFSTFSWLAFAVVAGWLLAYGARERLTQGLSRLWYNTAQIAFGLLALLAFAAILNSIPNGLLGEPDMSVAGFGSGGDTLRWFADQTESVTPEAAVWSLPLWVYKGLILAWALWLTLALLRWLPWAWRRFSAGGLWQPKAKAPAPAESKPADAEPTPEAGTPPPTKDVW